MSSALQAKKRKEAEENLKQADKYLAKTMLRWAPDYLAAAPHLEKAADAFRAAGDHGMAKRVFTQAAAVQIKNKSSFRAAQNYENVAKVVVQQIKDTRASGSDKLALLAEVKKAYDSASSNYGDMGELGKAADALMKGAACCEENGMTDVKQLKDLYARACSLMEAQDKPHFAVDPFRKTLGFFVKNAMYQDALELLGRLVEIFKQIDQQANVHKCYLSEIVLVLTTGDVAAADKAYMRQLQEDAYLSSDECALAEDLVRAYKLGNEELLQTTIRKQGFSFLDNQISRISRKLTIYGGGAASFAAPPARAAPTPAPVTPSSRTQNQQRPQQPRAAPSLNPFAPPEAPAQPPAPASAPAPAPAPAPAQTSAPVPVRVAPVAAAPPVAVAPPTVPEYDTSEITEDFNFDDTAARATVAFGTGDARGASAFDFDSLEFAMPSEEELNSQHSTATESSYATEHSSAAADSQLSRQKAPAPVIADDDMFDLT